MLKLFKLSYAINHCESKMVGYHVNKCKLVSTRLQLHSISLRDLIADWIEFLLRWEDILAKRTKIAIISINNSSTGHVYQTEFISLAVIKIHIYAQHRWRIWLSGNTSTRHEKEMPTNEEIRRGRRKNG